MNGVKDLESLLVSVEIERFLSGETNGEVLLHALYDPVALEPVPERLRAVVLEHCPKRAVTQAAIAAPPPVSAAAS